MDFIFIIRLTFSCRTIDVINERVTNISRTYHNRYANVTNKELDE